MAISSRTPEGLPHRCPVCGEIAALEPSYPGGDACCPACGQLLWEFRDQLTRRGVPSEISLDADFADLGMESLDLVELVMDLEEKYNVSITDEDAASLRTVNDAIRYILWIRRRADDA